GASIVFGTVAQFGAALLAPLSEGISSGWRYQGKKFSANIEIFWLRCFDEDGFGIGVVTTQLIEVLHLTFARIWASDVNASANCPHPAGVWVMDCCIADEHGFAVRVEAG